jgi:uroporphyrin-3 C-methyltransferase
VTEDNAQQPKVDASVSIARGDTSKVLEALSKSNSATSRPKPREPRRFLVLIILLLPVLIAIAFLLFEQSRTDAMLAELLSKDAALEEALANVPVALPAPTPVAPPEQLSLPDNLADTDMLDELSANLDSRINALARSAATMQERLGALPQTGENAGLMWAEADYLLRLANQKLQLEGDGDSALLILSAVDEMLRDSGETSVLGVRDLLDSEMLALRNMDYVDVSGLYMRINALIPLIDQLSLRNAVVENYNAQLVQTRNAIATSDEGMFDKALAILESIFVWEDWDVESEALLPPPQEAILKQNLHLILEQAQLSLLMAETQIYVDSLKKGAQWTDRYFAIDTGAGHTLKIELEKLAEIKITEDRPDISGSLELLRQVDADRNQPITNDVR